MHWAASELKGAEAERQSVDFAIFVATMINKRKLLKWVILTLILLPVVLVLLVAGLLYIPYVQDQAVRLASDKLTEQIGMPVSLERLRLSFPLSVSMRNLNVVAAPEDTLAHLGSLRLSVSAIPLLRGRVVCPRAEVEQLRLRLVDSASLGSTQLRLERLSADDLRVLPDEGLVRLSRFALEGGYVHYYSVAPSSTEEELPSIPWRILAEEIQLSDTSIEMHLPLDSLQLSTYVRSLSLGQLQADLERMRFELASLSLSAPSLCYNTHEAERPVGYLDPGAIELTGIYLQAQDMISEGSRLQLRLCGGEAKERSGFHLKNLSLRYAQDSLGIKLEDLSLGTEHSQLEGEVSLPWSVLDLNPETKLGIQLRGRLALADLMVFSAGRLEGFEGAERWRRSAYWRRASTLDLDLQVSGSLATLSLDRGSIHWPKILEASLVGQLEQVHRPEETSGFVQLSLHSGEYLPTLAELFAPKLFESYRLPEDMRIEGQIKAKRGDYSLELYGQEDEARIELEGHYKAQGHHYDGRVEIERLDLRHYMPRDSIGLLEASLELSGRGIDLFDTRTQAQLRGRLRRLQYGRLDLDSISIDGELALGALSLSVNSNNAGLDLGLQMDGLLSDGWLYSGIAIDGREIDLGALGGVDMPMDARFRLEGELRSDMKQGHQFSASLSDARMHWGSEAISTQAILFKAETSARGVSARLSSGELEVKIRLDRGLDALSLDLDRLSLQWQPVFSSLVEGRPSEATLSQLLSELPPMQASLKMGREHALRPYLARHRIALAALEGELSTGAASGLSGYLHLSDLRLDTLRIRSAKLDLSTLEHPWRMGLDSLASERAPRGGLRGSLARGRASRPIIDPSALCLHLYVDKPYYRNSKAFVVKSNLYLNLQRMELSGSMTDADERPIHSLSLGAAWLGDRYTLRLLEPQVRLSYQTLEVNPDNLIALNRQSKMLSADLSLKGQGGTFLSLKSKDTSPEVQDLNLIVRQLRLQDLRELGLPEVSGIVYADLRYLRRGDLDQQPAITGDLSVSELIYEGKPLGHFNSALFYEPRNNSSHYLTAEVGYSGDPLLSLHAIYYPDEAHEQIEGDLTLERLPLELANPFLSAFKLHLEGKLDGSLALSGKVSDPRLSGTLTSSAGSIYLQEYATRLRMDDRPLRFEGTQLHFDRYALRSQVDSLHPIYIDGSVEVLGERMAETDLRLQAKEITLLDEREPREGDQLLYGRLLASADMTLKGAAEALEVRGGLTLLSGTNCTYIFREGLLQEENRLDDLVRFVDLTDTLFAEKVQEVKNLGGLDVRLGIDIDPTVRFGVDLGAAGRDYMRIQGGGNLQLSIPPYGDMRLVGRYNMSGGGELRYTMPLIGTRTFSIDPSGYLSWNGEMSNPYVYFSASQRVKSTVTEAGGGTQRVNFLVGIRAEDHVERINLSFDLSAPENLSVQNSLLAMSQEERGKQAIGLLATGVYLADGGAGAKFNFDNALSALLQSQINKAAGDLLQGTDLNLGLEHSDGSDGGMRYTNYIYSFSRRFYNDRLRIVVGGKVQSGQEASNAQQQFIDNIAVEYQLDKAGHQHLRLYHKRITDDILEGEYSETGVGYILRRKLRTLADLWPWRRRSTRTTSEQSTEED